MDTAIDTRMPLIGDQFPGMEVTTTHGTISLPNHFAGKWFILFSHPGDFTPVCTTEFVAFATRHDDFRRLNTELIGLSVDQVIPHLKWIQWIDNNLKVTIKFPVIGDETGITARRLGMIHPQKGTNTVRAVFIVDNKGIIRAILYYPQETGRNISEILRLIHALQVTEKYSVATPANWPRNNLIGDHVIVPPPKTEKLAKEKLEKMECGEIECFDWWFCHHPLDSHIVSAPNCQAYEKIRKKSYY
jgi:peroxiredoxin (alkyl hydroperoxide reductase subunit C)